MLYGTKVILDLFRKDEFKPFIIIGDHGYGKSSYATSLISDVYGHVFNNGDPYWKNFTPIVKDWFEYHIGFNPKEVLDEWQFTEKREQWLSNELGPYPRLKYNDWQFEHKRRDFVYCWDDAGLWLNSLDFQDPFVKDAGKYMQVVRSDWACVIFTAISSDDITSKIRGLRNAIIVEVTKHSNAKQPYRRVAEAYILRKSYKGRLWKDTQWKDEFDCHVPDPFYEWYQPLRSRYASIAKQLMRKKLEKNKDLNIILDNGNNIE